MNTDEIRARVERFPHIDSYSAMAADVLACLAKIAALEAELSKCEQEIDAMDERRADEWSRAEAAEAEVVALRAALERLASLEGFEGAGIADGDSFAERELRARGKFAAAALAREEQT